MLRRFDLIVFDWDGTLMDSEAKIVNCICAAAADCGFPDPGRLAARNIIGLGLKEALSTLFPELTNQEQEQLAERYRQHFLHHDQTHMPLFPDVLAGLTQLAERGYQLAVATGKARRGLERVLQETGTRHLFLATRCADEAFSKPHPKMLEDILYQTGFERTQTLMVGDTTYDLQMAQNAQIASVGVTYGVHARERLLEHNPLTCVGSFQELCLWLN